LKFSKTHDAIRFKYKGASGTFALTGKIKIKKAKRKADEQKIVKLLERCAWPAKICECGSTAIDCARGTCRYCTDMVCEVMGGKPGQESDSGKNILRRTEGLQPAIAKMGLLVDEFKRLVDTLAGEHKLDPFGKNYDEQFDDINRDISAFMASEKRDEDAALGIFVAGVAAGIKENIDKLIDLGVVGIDQNDTDSLVEARNLVVSAFHAFSNSNVMSAINVAMSWNNFFEKYKQSKEEIRQIGYNGSCIANLINRPVPK
jgi:hypothetical protein